MNWFTLLLVVLVSFICNSPTLAKGHHIQCKLSGVVNKDSVAQQNIERTLRFYLDDSAEILVSETGDLGVKTDMYSDTRIDAQLFDDGLSAPSPLFAIFGNIAGEPASLTIDRKTGKIAIGAKLFNGSDLEFGDCAEISAGSTKF